MMAVRNTFKPFDYHILKNLEQYLRLYKAQPKTKPQIHFNLKIVLQLSALVMVTYCQRIPWRNCALICTVLTVSLVIASIYFVTV